MTTAVAFVAHPDDESFAAGGLLAALAAGGADVFVVAATRGEAGVDLHDGLTGAALGDRRVGELAVACAALGIHPPRVLNLRDGALEADACATALARHLDALTPTLVVTLDRDGAYGHPDHLACTEAVSMVVDDPAVRVLHCAFARGLFAPLHRRLSRAGLDLRVPEDRLGVSRDAVDAVFPLGRFAETKRRALAAHRSQLRTPGDPSSFLMPGLIAPLFSQEWYRRDAGPRWPPGPLVPALIG